MSEDSDSKRYLYSGLEDQDGASACSRGASACSSMAQLHRLGGFGQGGPDLGLPSEGSHSSGQDPPASLHRERKGARSLSLQEEDVEMKSSGSSGSGTESHGNESHGDESRGNESRGNESTGSSNGTSKDSALLESSGSNKSSNSHSPSPPSSSNAFSLLSSEQDNPSTSGCSSEESAKAKTQKELLKTLKELKRLLPAEKRNNKSTTLNTLKYALRCVKQVEANEEYYQLLMSNDSQPSGLDVCSYTIEEIDSITSEYTLKNNDIFAVAVSLITGKIVYISDQAASILNCPRDVFKNAKFVEFLTPQDVSVFYSFTTPYRLPSWTMCTGAESSPSDCMQEKSFFCRISGGKECQGDLQYYPFRMTPYLMKVQDTEQAEEQFCCLLLAERVHSGYDAPRIPTDKRIFTTTHTPSCVFQDVDERAVPLLGYLPQDLIGTPVLLHLHPNDRPIMLAIHRKILQYAGQPFDHSSVRFCARNGEYVMIDTSWSSFVNPWSRKVSFVIGRHKVRMGPVNEDVFVAPPAVRREGKTMDPEIQEITEQIHRMLLQPVHNNGSSGYGSNDHLMGMTSSGESTGKGSGQRDADDEGDSYRAKSRPQRTFQEICKGIHRQKSLEQQVYLSSSKPELKKTVSKSAQKSSAVVRPKETAAPLSWMETGTSPEEGKATGQEELAFNDQTVYSYQQISCLDSVIRYLDGCSLPIPMKRKCQSSSNTSSSSSDEDKQKGSNPRGVSEAPLKAQPDLSSLDDADKKPPVAVVGTSLAPLAVPSKADSVVSITSQCSDSSTIVHVGDKKPQRESELTEDASGAGETAESLQMPGPPPSAVSPPSQEREPYKKLGLTKQVLAAHTQKEEQAFLCRFRELRGVHASKADCCYYLDRQRGQMATDAVHADRSNRSFKQGGPGAEPGPRRAGRNKKTKSKRVKQNTSSDSTSSLHRQQQQQTRPPLLNQGLNQTSWSRSDTSQSTFPMAYPGVLPAYPLQVFPGASPCSDPSLQRFGPNPDPRCPTTLQPSPYAAVVALVLPNYVFPQMANPPAPQQPYYQPELGGFPPQTHPYLAQAPPYPAQAQPFPAQAQTYPAQAQTFPTQGQTYPAQGQTFPCQAQTFPCQAQTFPCQAQTFPAQAQTFPAQAQTFPAQAQTFPNQFHPFPAQPQPYPPQTAYPGQGPFLAQAYPFAPQPGFPAQPFPSSLPSERQKAPPEGPSRSSTPQSVGGRDPQSPPLFQSRCSSPLQLNLLQLEDSLRSIERQDSTSAAGDKGGNMCIQAMDKELLQPSLSAPTSPTGPLSLQDTHCACEGLSWDKVYSRMTSFGKESHSPEDGNHSDANTSSSDMLDILLQEDTGSATSGSMGSHSNGCGTSNSRTSASGASASGTSGSGTGSSNNSSNYFGSVDSSQNSQKVKGHSGSGPERSMEVEPDERFKYVVQDPLWLLMANADDAVMMTYQLPARDMTSVLRTDREKLRQMQKGQPRFTDDQRKELVEVHPWLRRGSIPKAIAVEAFLCCDEATETNATEEQPDLDMGDTETGEVISLRTPSQELSNTDGNAHRCPSPDPGP
ncbi:period circadian protein homolog 2 [Aplochiton taeniatus]